MSFDEKKLESLENHEKFSKYFRERLSSRRESYIVVEDTPKPSMFIQE